MVSWSTFSQSGFLGRVLLLAAEYHENRHDPGAGQGGWPAGVLALIERWRTVRVLGGGA